MRPPRAHDLIRIDPAISAGWDDAPAWVRAGLDRAPWVVVRRACTKDDIPVGVRGAERAERFAARIDASAIRELVVPEQLVERIRTLTHRLAAAARAVDSAACALGIAWGPAGSYGFELASGTAATHAASDLDIVVSGGPARSVLRDFAGHCKRIERATGVRVDADVLFDDYGVALQELVSSVPMVLTKTPAGPLLVTAPP